MLLSKPIMQPWAFQYRKGFKGEAPGLYYRYFETEEEAKKSIEKLDKENKWHGLIEYRPNESWFAGYI